ncbi:50S ribosomal protein L44e [Candidatus Woesearchaeota archaeon]|nr:50S ribosomal protein L44e [Candidatus Woesearchaeota archaeon]
MKIPKVKNRYCPYCRKHTEHKVTNQRFKGLNKAHPQSRGSKPRVRGRGRRRGMGNWGRYSRKAISAWKMTGSKVSKKSDLRYQCKECKKTHVQRIGFRAKKLEFSEQ